MFYSNSCFGGETFHSLTKKKQQTIYGEMLLYDKDGDFYILQILKKNKKKNYISCYDERSPFVLFSAPLHASRISFAHVFILRSQQADSKTLTPLFL